MYARGQTDPENIAQLRRVDPKRPERQAAGVIHALEVDDYQQSREILRDYRRYRNAADPEFQHDDKEKIQRHIHKPRECQDIQRALGVARGADYRGAEVISHKPRRAEEIDLEVERRKVDNVVGGVHYLEHFARGEEAEHADKKAAKNAQKHRSMHAFAHALVVILADVPCDHNARAH